MWKDKLRGWEVPIVCFLVVIVLAYCSYKQEHPPYGWGQCVEDFYKMHRPYEELDKTCGKYKK